MTTLINKTASLLRVLFRKKEGSMSAFWKDQEAKTLANLAEAERSGNDAAAQEYRSMAKEIRRLRSGDCKQGR